MYFTTILHHVRKSYKLSCNEYCVVELIFYKSNDPKSKMIGWCTISRQQIADELDLSRQTIISILHKLKEKGLIEENELNFLKTTEIWYNAVSTCKETLHPVKKLDTMSKNITPTCKETLHPPVKKLDTTLYINKETNKIEEEEEKNITSEIEIPYSSSPSIVEDFFYKSFGTNSLPPVAPPPQSDYLDELREIINSQSAEYESIGMILRVSKEKIVEIYNDFEVEQRFKKVKHTSMKDAKSHLISYARKFIQNEQKNDNSKRNRGKVERHTTYDYSGTAF